MRFRGVHYDPQLSKWTYGKTQIGQEIPAELAGHSYLFDLTGSDVDGSFEQTDSVTLERHRETTMSHSTEMNYSASSQTTIGGTLYGVSLEEQLTLSFGKTFKTEQTQAQGESTAHMTSHAFNVALEALLATLVTLESVQVHASTPFDIDGVIGMTADVYMPGTPCIPDHIYDSGPFRYSQEWLDWYYHGPGLLCRPGQLGLLFRGDRQQQSVDHRHRRLQLDVRQERRRGRRDQ